MSLNDRAAQFAPFAALTKFGDEIKESNRKTEDETEADAEYIEFRLHEIERAALKGAVKAKAKYFIRDEKKAGGRYEVVRGTIKKIDKDSSSVVFENGTKVYFKSLITIEIEEDK